MLLLIVTNEVNTSMHIYVYYRLAVCFWYTNTSSFFTSCHYDYRQQNAKILEEINLLLASE